MRTRGRPSRRSRAAARPTRSAGRAGRTPRAVPTSTTTSPRASSHAAWTGRSAAEPIAQHRPPGGVRPSGWCSGRSARGALFRLRRRGSVIGSGRRRRWVGPWPRYSLLEFAQRLSDGARKLGQLLGPEEEDPEREGDPDVLWSDHGFVSAADDPWGTPGIPRIAAPLTGSAATVSRSSSGRARASVATSSEAVMKNGVFPDMSFDLLLSPWDGRTREWIADGLSRPCGRVERSACGMARARHKRVVGGAKRPAHRLAFPADNNWRMTWQRFARSRSW